jgi:hypothetical protein
MRNPIVELATFKLKQGKSEADLLSASGAFQTYLDGVPGFVRRELLKVNEGQFIDLVHWQSRGDADALMAKAGDSPECLAYFSVMDMAAMAPDEAVKHYASLASYGAR